MKKFTLSLILCLRNAILWWGEYSERRLQEVIYKEAYCIALNEKFGGLYEENNNGM